MKAEVGFLQELQSNGKVANSLMRGISALLIITAITYLFVQLTKEYTATTYLWELLKNRIIDNSTYLVMKADVPRVDWTIFSTILGGGIGGKIVQKFGEASPVNN
jgi:hypothetical protein